MRLLQKLAAESPRLGSRNGRTQGGDRRHRRCRHRRRRGRDLPGTGRAASRSTAAAASAPRVRRSTTSTRCRCFRAPRSAAARSSEIEPEDVLVITVGAHTKAGQSRLDMLQGNLDVMAATAEAIERGGLPRIAIVVSSPLDVLTEYLTRRWAGRAGVGDGIGHVARHAPLHRAARAGVRRAPAQRARVGGRGARRLVGVPVQRRAHRRDVARRLRRAAQPRAHARVVRSGIEQDVRERRVPGARACRARRGTASGSRSPGSSGASAARRAR